MNGPMVTLSGYDPVHASCQCGWQYTGMDYKRRSEAHSDTCILFVAHRYDELDALADLVGHIPTEVLDMLEALASEPGAGHRLGRHLSRLIEPEDDDG